MSHEIASQIPDGVLQEIARALEQLRYGSIEIVVHEGKVTQIERREKIRFGPEQQKLEQQRIKPIASSTVAKH
ncbi:MAG: YezD family protein [Methylophilaceae bacterium]